MKITFNAIHRSLTEDERLVPRPAARELPDWKADIPVKVAKGEKTGKSVRACPGIDDYLHLGYIIPLWTDVRLTRIRVNQFGQSSADPNGNKIHWKTGYGSPPFEFHPQEQVQGAEPLEPPVGLTDLIKPLCPWFVVTPPGWSVLILPLQFHERKRKVPLQPLPGVINTDHWHQINTACKWVDVEPVMDMKAGTPFMHLIPFRRSKKLEQEIRFVRDQMEWENLKGFQSDFTGSYRRQQKNAEKARPSDEEE